MIMKRKKRLQHHSIDKIILLILQARKGETGGDMSSLVPENTLKAELLTQNKKRRTIKKVRLFNFIV